jgi:uncharacterized membrane protein SpoIIM required for sporulation
MSEELMKEIIQALPHGLFCLTGGLIIYGAGQWFNNACIKSMEKCERQLELNHRS